MYAIRSYYDIATPPRKVRRPLHSEDQVVPLYKQLGLQYAFKPVVDLSPEQQVIDELSSLAKFREVANVALGKGAAIMADHLREFIVITSYSIHYTKLYEITKLRGISVFATKYFSENRGADLNAPVYENAGAREPRQSRTPHAAC